MREDPRSAEIIKPYLRGQDVKRWSPEWQGLWMIFARRGIDIEAYPAIKRHLQYRDRLEPRPRAKARAVPGRSRARTSGTRYRIVWTTGNSSRSRRSLLRTLHISWFGPTS
ncbi:MAG: hypothetical protein WKH64_04350 [Chloroflexia bacterium]